METIYPANIDQVTSEKSTEMKTKSGPISPLKRADEVQIKTQISAPSYLHSLNENDAPPFRKPGKEPKPHLVIGTIMNEAEVVGMIAAAGNDGLNGLKTFLGYSLIEKKITENYNLSEKKFLISLLTETIDYAAQRDFDAFKLSVLISIYIHTHLHFKWYYWQPPAAIWAYFKDLMIRHTIEDSPDGQEVFSPEECYDIITHFNTIYFSNLPLIHILTFGTHRLKFIWPFKPVKG